MFYFCMFVATIKPMKKIIASFFLALTCIMPCRSFAWGKAGHELVAEIAFHYLDDATKQAVMKYLKRMTIEAASTWMDENRSDHFYDYMRTWHYIDITKGEEYHPSAEKNMLTVLNSAIYALQHKDGMKDKDIKQDLLLIFHLVGDLHQPLHTGYPEDKGGNTVEIKSPIYNGNLHSFWDTQIIEAENIKLDDCLALYNNFTAEEIKSINKLNVLQWMKQSRALLDGVYDFTDGKIDQAYIDKNKEVIKKQLLIGGLRLASILRNVFKVAQPQPSMGTAPANDTSAATNHLPAADYAKNGNSASQLMDAGNHASTDGTFSMGLFQIVANNSRQGRRQLTVPADRS